jgi:hypothetical protein
VRICSAVTIGTWRLTGTPDDETGFALKNYGLRNLLALTQINHIDFCAE